MFGRLSRHALRLGGRQFVLALGLLLAVLVAGLIAPLVGRGANWLDVLVYLPQQLALPLTLTIPVAVMSSAALTIAGLGERRELIALASVGIAHRRPMLALLPLVLFAVLITAWLAHLALPRAMQAVREARSELVSQALSLRAARQQPIVQSKGNGVIVLDCDGSTVQGVIGHRQDDDGSYTVAYAPRGVLLTEPVSGGQRFEFDLEDLRLLRIEDGGERITAVHLPRAGSGLVMPQTLRSRPADVLTTEEISRVIPWLRELRQRLAAADRQAPLWPLLFAGLGLEGAEGPRRREELEPLLHEGLLALALGDGPLAGQARALAARRGAASDQRSDLVEALSRGFPPEAKAGQQGRAFIARSASELVKLELNWHLRWALVCCPLSFWLLGCGLGLRFRLRNQALVPLLAIVAIMLAVGPAIGLVDGLRGRLAISPAWLLWPVQAVYAGLGLWWMRELRP
jgi:lipopolysaccharide export LptBFGC system permease protein LptF